MNLPFTWSAVALSVSLVIGCAAERAEPGAVGAETTTSIPDTAAYAEDASTLIAQVEERYLVGPAAARNLGYRVSWQYPSSGSRIRLVQVTGDSVFTLDERNFMTRLRRVEGDRVWRIPVAAPVERIFGIAYIADLDRIYLLTGSELLVLDAASGSRIAKQKLGKIANTAPIVVGRHMIYGSRNGQLIWHAFEIDSTRRGYQISRSIQVAPVHDDGYVVAVGNDGRIMSLRVDTASQVWTKKALAPVVAEPAIGNGAVYVASQDQHLRAYELRAPRSPLWEYLTESALTKPPFLVDDRVYQQVPSEGLVCLEALPLDSPGGVVIWRAENATGNVVAASGNRVLAWNGAQGRLEVVDARLGAVIETVDLPALDKMMASDAQGSEIYATGHDGRITRLVPRHRK